MRGEREGENYLGKAVEEVKGQREAGYHPAQLPRRARLETTEFFLSDDLIRCTSLESLRRVYPLRRPVAASSHQQPISTLSAPYQVPIEDAGEEQAVRIGHRATGD